MMSASNTPACATIRRVASQHVIYGNHNAITDLTIAHNTVSGVSNRPPFNGSAILVVGGLQNSFDPNDPGASENRLDVTIKDNLVTGNSNPGEYRWDCSSWAVFFRRPITTSPHRSSTTWSRTILAEASAPLLAYLGEPTIILTLPCETTSSRATVFLAIRSGSGCLAVLLPPATTSRRPCARTRSPTITAMAFLSGLG